MKSRIQTVLIIGLLLLGAAGSGFGWTTRVERYVKHTVQIGDTLEKLARIYGTSEVRIMAKNGIEPDAKLVQGQRLIIPVSGYKEKLII